MSILPSISQFITILSTCFVISSAGKLLSVTTLARHGDRTPAHTFKNDPYANKWALGLEQLTDLGSNQHIELGRFIRQRYKKFLPSTYHKDLVYVRSTATERTLMSAYSCMAGLFPKEPTQSSTNTLGHQLIPVHSVFKPFDQLLKMSSPCPIYKKLWKQYQLSPAFLAESAKYSNLFGVLSTVTQEPNVSMSKAWAICDPVVIWVMHNLTLPSWLTQSLIEDCRTARNYKHTVHFSTPELRRYRGGPFVRHLIADMKSRVAGETSRQLTSYFAHDSTLAAVMSHLGVYNRLVPPLASCLFIELWTDDDGAANPYVRFFFRNSTGQLPIPLVIPDCGQDCSLVKMSQLFANTSPVDITEACSPLDQTKSGRHLSSNTGPSLLVVFLIVLVILELLLLLRCYLKQHNTTRQRNYRTD